MRKILLTFLMLIAAMPLWAQSWTKELEKSAKKGDVNSQLIIANAYFKGDGITANKEKAAQWYYKATINNNAEAKQKLYSFYSKELEKAAKGGDAQAQYEVGMDYYSGEGIAKNTETAAKWFHLASTQGHEEAKKMLYSFYSKELEKAAKGGDAQAQYEVGMDYFVGTEITKNAVTAAKWFDLAKAQGHKEASDKLYTFYSKILENYAKQGDAKAQYCVAEAYLNGVEVVQNYPKAANFFNNAHLQGYKNAKEKLYSFYSKELKKLAKTDVDAQYALALAYYNGVGTKRNTERAGEYLSMAMDNGHKKAGELLYSFDSYARQKRTYTVELYSREMLTASKDVGQPFTIEGKNCYLTGIAKSINVSPIRNLPGSYSAYISAKITKSRINIGSSQEIQLTGPVIISVSYGKPLDIKVLPGVDIAISRFEHMTVKESSTISPGYEFYADKLYSIEPVPYNLSSDELSNLYFDNYDFDSKANLNKDSIKNCHIEYILDGESYFREEKRYLTLKMNNGGILKFYSLNGGRGYALTDYSSADKSAIYKYDSDRIKCYKRFSDGTAFSYDEFYNKGYLPDGSTFTNRRKFDSLFSIMDFINLSSCKDKDEFSKKIINIHDDESFKSIREKYNKNSKVGKGFDASTGRPELKVSIEMTKNGTTTCLYKENNKFLTQKQVDIIQKDYDKKINSYYKQLYSSYGKANVEAIQRGQLRKGMSINLVDEFYDVARDWDWNGKVGRYYVTRFGVIVYVVYCNNNKITDWFRQ